MIYRSRGSVGPRRDLAFSRNESVEVRLVRSQSGWDKVLCLRYSRLAHLVKSYNGMEKPEVLSSMKANSMPFEGCYCSSVGDDLWKDRVDVLDAVRFG